MRSLIKSKKGELTDIMVFLITMFILGIGLFVLVFIVPKITGGLRLAGLNNSVAGANAIDTLESGGTSMINNGFLILFVGLILAEIITAFLVRTHPIFLFLYIIFLGISIFLSFYLGNAFYAMQQNAIFADTLANANFITLIMGHIAEITLAVGAFTMIVIFAKFSTFGGTQQF